MLSPSKDTCQQTSLNCIQNFTVFQIYSMLQFQIYLVCIILKCLAKAL